MPGSNSYDLLLIDDEAGFRNAAAKHFRRHGYRVTQAGDGEHALRLARGRRFNVATVDMFMQEGVSGIELLRRIRSESECQVVVLSRENTINTAVEAMKLGAYDFLQKPVQLPKLEAVVERACESPPAWLVEPPHQNATRPFDMIGESAPMRNIYRLITRAGPSDRPILIQGETGTGKELAARALHSASERNDKPLIALNCAAFSETLLESELFGHEKGAFTNAIAAKRGLIEAADGGTLLIDEIGDMPRGLQAKLLRVLENGTLRRVGAVQERHVDVRILTASNRVLADEVRARRFREDLYYRINVMSLLLPPLRERRSDIPLLARHLAGAGWKITADAMQAFSNYDWPGNVRQLRNVIERAKILTDNKVILSGHLPPKVAESARCTRSCVDTSSDDLDAIKRERIELVMARENGNKSRAARALGVSRRTLYRLLDRYELPGLSGNVTAN